MDRKGLFGGRIHYAWVVMIAFGLTMAGTLGTLTVLAGAFFYPVCEDIGCDLSTLTLYTTIMTVVLALTLPLVGELLTKVKIHIILTVAALLEIGSLACMSFFTEPWMWYVTGAISGLGLAATSTVTITPTMGNWFYKRTGLAIGMVWAIQSFYDAIASPVINSIILQFGWRTGYLCLAGLSAIIVLPCTIFLIRYRPEDKGMLPYGYDEETAKARQDGQRALAGVPAKQAFRSATFFLCVGLVMLCQLTACMNQVFSTYAEVVGLGLLVGGLMVSAASICDIFFNPIAGMTSDRFNPSRSMVLWTIITMVSFVILYFGSTSVVMSCIGAGINDAMYAICGVGYSTFALSLFGMRDFEKIFSRMVSVGSLVASLGVPLMMFIYEATGVFQNVFIFCFCLDIVIIALTLSAKKMGKALKWVRSSDGEAQHA